MIINMSLIDPNLLHDLDNDTTGWELHERAIDAHTDEQLVWHPDYRRAGYVLTGNGSSGRTTWTDASSVDDAWRRIDQDDIRN